MWLWIIDAFIPSLLAENGKAALPRARTRVAVYDFVDMHQISRLVIRVSSIKCYRSESHALIVKQPRKLPRRHEIRPRAPPAAAECTIKPKGAPPLDRSRSRDRHHPRIAAYTSKYRWKTFPLSPQL